MQVKVPSIDIETILAKSSLLQVESKEKWEKEIIRPL